MHLLLVTALVMECDSGKVEAPPSDVTGDYLFRFRRTSYRLLQRVKAQLPASQLTRQGLRRRSGRRRARVEDALVQRGQGRAHMAPLTLAVDYATHPGERVAPRHLVSTTEVR